MAELPREVAHEIAIMRSRGSVLDHRVRWHPETWRSVPLGSTEGFLEDAVALTGAHPGWISRSDVIALGVTDERLFLGAMIFGFGPVGYGPHRVHEMIKKTGPGLSGKLSAICTAGAAGPVAGWDAIRAQSTRITGLGIAFGTKVTYFASLRANPDTPVALIADINTSWGAWDAFKIPRSAERKASYVEYVDIAGSFASSGYRADEIEYALFKRGQQVLAERRRRR